eukprot:jgi/Bigna1/89018/estExt_fgenesh1_pg.C_420096
MCEYIYLYMVAGLDMGLKRLELAAFVFLLALCGATCERIKRPEIPQQITWFYANDLDIGASFLGDVVGLNEVPNLLQKKECRIFHSTSNHFCAVCNTRAAPNCTVGGPEEKDNPGKSTYTMVVSSKQEVDDWHTYLVQANSTRVRVTEPGHSSTYGCYAFNFYDKDTTNGLGCYRWEVHPPFLVPFSFVPCQLGTVTSLCHCILLRSIRFFLLAVMAAANYSRPTNVKTLWVGGLDAHMDEAFVYRMFEDYKNVIENVKVIRNKETGDIAGYGFVEFCSRDIAERVLTTLNSKPVPSNPGKYYRLNWAQTGGGSGVGPSFSIFVGDLAPDVTDYMLEQCFRQRYTTVSGARVVIDPATNISKGYGFIKFTDQMERDRAVQEMTGVYLSNRAMRVSVAVAKNGTGGSGDPAVQASTSGLLVTNIDLTLTESEVRSEFEEYGEITSLAMPVGKGVATVVYATREMAQRAIQGLNGRQIGNSCFRVRWASPQANAGAGYAAAAAAAAYQQYWYAAAAAAAYPYGAAAAYGGGGGYYDPAAAGAYGSTPNGVVAQDAAYGTAGAETSTQDLKAKDSKLDGEGAGKSMVMMMSTTAQIRSSAEGEEGDTKSKDSNHVARRAKRHYSLADSRDVKVNKLNKAFAQAQFEKRRRVTIKFTKTGRWLPEI